MVKVAEPVKAESEVKKTVPFFAAPTTQVSFAGKTIDSVKPTTKAESTPLFGQTKMMFSAPTGDHPVFGKAQPLA